jgi:transposase
LTGCKWKGLLELIEQVRARVSRETGRTVEVVSCYEAGYDGFWLHRQLEAHGVRNYVIDPASLQVDRRARRVKTDRIDTERLLRSLMAYLRGEPKVWSVVRVPSVAEEDAAAPRAGPFGLGTGSARQPHQGALRAPRHL